MRNAGYSAVRQDISLDLLDNDASPGMMHVVCPWSPVNSIAVSEGFPSIILLLFACNISSCYLIGYLLVISSDIPMRLLA